MLEGDLGKLIHPQPVKSGKPKLVKLQTVTHLGHKLLWEYGVRVKAIFRENKRKQQCQQPQQDHSDGKLA